MSSASYLPSEIGRLIYGYLRNNCNEEIAIKFLDTCESMKECRSRINFGFDSKFQNQFSLIQILNQYSTLSELIIKNASKDFKCTHMNIVYSLQKLLECRLKRLAEARHTDKTLASDKSVIPATEVRVKENAAANVSVRIEFENIENGSKNHDENCTPKKGAQSQSNRIDGSKTTNTPVPKKTSIEKSPIWDHSVKNILSSYSPRSVDQSSSISKDHEKTPNKKRKFETKNRLISSTGDDASTDKKRRKTSKKETESGDHKFKTPVSKDAVTEERKDSNSYYAPVTAVTEEFELYHRIQADPSTY